MTDQQTPKPGDLVRVDNWQPIETGPTDGTVVLLYLPNTNEIITGSSSGHRSATTQKLLWEETLSGYGQDWDPALFDDPTHWMPLPAPPATQDGEEGRDG